MIAGRNGLLVIGETAVARRVCATLEGSRTDAAKLMHLVAPGDDELAQALGERPRAVAVLVRQDVAALRYALAVAHLDDCVPLTVTVFDRTIADQLRLFLPQASVMSPADLAVPSLVGACLGRTVVASFRQANSRSQVELVNGALVTRHLPMPPSRRLARLVLSLGGSGRLHDPGTRLLFVGLLGLLAVLVTDWFWLAIVEHHPPDDAFLDAVRVVATVGPGATGVSDVYEVMSGVGMLLTIGFTGVFTAGLIDRLLQPRLLGLVGVRTPPRSGHVIVVGMGQIGVRLCAELVNQGIQVIGVERDRHAPHLRLACALKIPVVIGHGSDRELLERLGLSRCLALAAVASDDLDNVAVAVAATAVSPHVRVVLRAGEQEAIAETRSLLPLGTTRDVTQIAATWVIARLVGREAGSVIAGPDALFLSDRSGGGYTAGAVSARGDCVHVETSR